jgi:MEMO1 family protein
MSTRKTTVAGSFYPALEEDANNLIDNLLKSEIFQIKTNITNKKVLGGIVPHAGYSYSGPEAVHFFYILSKYAEQFDTFVILFPDHFGYGSEISVDTHENWETPMGNVNLDKELIDMLPFEQKELAHRHEHAGEVMLPYLKHFLKYPFQIVPIAITEQNLANARFIAKELYKANQVLNKKICLIASSDFSHSRDIIHSEQLDQLAVDEIMHFRASGLEEIVHKNHISICGYGPIMTVIEYTLLVSNQPKIEILAKGNSSQTDPSSENVNYICGLVYENI